MTHWPVTRWATTVWRERALIGAAVLLIVALSLGGAGSSHGTAELQIEIVALFVAAAAFAWPLPASEGWFRAPPVVLFGLWVVLAALQLLPLPADVWQSLPGRGLAAAIAREVGLGAEAHALTLDPAATRRALAALVPAGTMLALVVHMNRSQRNRLAIIAIICTLASLLLGLVQLVTPGHWGALYSEGHVGYPTGFFANRNHQASFLLIGAALSCAFARRPGPLMAPMLLIIVALMAGALATRSRAAMLLLPLALLPLLHGRIQLRWRAFAPVLLALIAAGVVLVRTNPVAQIIVDRLWDGNFRRLVFWRDTWSAILGSWPVGTGFGTFASVFRVAEPLEQVGTHYVNHAHNEFLEALLEGGLPALLVLSGGFLWWLAQTRRIWRPKSKPQELEPAAWTALLILMLHSLVDYPVRMLPIEVLAAILVGFLVPSVPRPSGLRRIQSADHPCQSASVGYRRARGAARTL